MQGNTLRFRGSLGTIFRLISRIAVHDYYSNCCFFFHEGNSYLCYKHYEKVPVSVTREMIIIAPFLQGSFPGAYSKSFS